MILFSHPLGNANARQAALALEEAALLAEAWTCLAWTPGSRADRLLPGALTRELRRRSFPESVRSKLHTAPWREALRLVAGRLPGGSWLTRHETGPASVDAVFRGLDRAVARRLRAGVDGVRGVYAYEDGAAETFRAAGERGLTRFYDLPIGYWRAGQAIFDEEAAREPEWAATLTGRSDSAAKLARKDDELRRADAVIVASTFTQSTLAAAPDGHAPVHVVPYGAPEPVPTGERVGGHPRGADGRLRVLFAGSLGQRKGLSYLLDAVGRLGSRVELTLLGSKTVEGCAPLDRAVREHRWIPTAPNAEVLAEMSRHDVLVFPSLFEGFGLVIPEALSRGLPVITTPHTAGPDLLDDGVDGFLVPIRSAEAIAEKLELLLLDPARRQEMSRAALRKAAQLSWQTHRRALAAVLENSLLPTTPALLPV